MDNNLLASNLKAIRIKQGWSQAFVSEITGLSIRSISRAETGHSISEKTMKTLCSVYRIDAGALYQPTKDTKTMKMDLLPINVTTSLLYRNSFLEELQREVILRFSSSIGKQAIMSRGDVENVLADIISDKKLYTISEIVMCCLTINQKTIQNIIGMAVG